MHVDQIRRAGNFRNDHFVRGARRLVHPVFRRTGITGRNQLFKSELLEMQGEILEKVALIRIVAGTQDRFTPKNIGIVLQVRPDLLGDVRPLRVELVAFGFFRLGQFFVGHDFPFQYPPLKTRNSPAFWGCFS